jgi:hypothetical protein
MNKWALSKAVDANLTAAAVVAVVVVDMAAAVVAVVVADAVVVMVTDTVMDTVMVMAAAGNLFV